MTLDHLEKSLGYTFSNPSLLTQALTHPSARNELNLSYDNQRMEYLGDAALGLSAADYLYRQFPDLPEGRMTMLRSMAASTATLAALGRKIDIGPYLILGKGEETSGGRNKENNLADAIEAIMGAIYLDGGPDAVGSFFRKHLSEMLEHASQSGFSSNPKGMLQEWAQQNGYPCPEYEVTNEVGQPHQKTFTIRVYIGNLLEGSGNGSTKRAAEADAASQLLEKLPGIESQSQNSG